MRDHHHSTIFKLIILRHYCAVVFIRWMDNSSDGKRHWLTVFDLGRLAWFDFANSIVPTHCDIKIKITLSLQLKHILHHFQWLQCIIYPYVLCPSWCITGFSWTRGLYASLQAGHPNIVAQYRKPSIWQRRVHKSLRNNLLIILTFGTCIYDASDNAIKQAWDRESLPDTA